MRGVAHGSISAPTLIRDTFDDGVYALGGRHHVGTDRAGTPEVQICTPGLQYWCLHAQPKTLTVSRRARKFDSFASSLMGAMIMKSSAGLEYAAWSLLRVTQPQRER